MQNNNAETQIYKKLFSNLGFYFVVTDYKGGILKISSRLKARLGMNENLSKDSFQNYFIEKKIFYTFLKNSESNDKKSVNKYRTLLIDTNKNHIPVEISSFQSRNKSSNNLNIWFLIQELPKEFISRHLDTGSFEENIKTHQIANRYLSRQIIQKARNAVRNGLDYIPGEVQDLTLFFGDLASFTSYAEHKKPKEVINTLNRTIGAASQAILHWDGIIDKYIGDSIFAIFKDPLKAVTAAVEIQKMFTVFNEFRSISNEEELFIRIGINTGNCIQDTVGSSGDLNLTVIGDAVNIASRLEKSSKAGQILISEGTAKTIFPKLKIIKEMNLFLKGHKEGIKAYFIEGVKFTNEAGKVIELSINS